MGQAHAPDANHYYVPHSSRWPFLGSIALFTTMVGLASWFNDASWGMGLFFFGVALLLGVLFGWFGDVIRESIHGNYNRWIRNLAFDIQNSPVFHQPDATVTEAATP